MMKGLEPINNTVSDLDFRTTPNYLTLFRILLVPVLVYLLFLRTDQADLIAALVFAAAGLTDFLDGYIARKQGLITVYGKLLDPLADKFLVVSALIMLLYLERIHPVLIILLICRELGITGLRALASAEGIIIPASKTAKWKTITQMIAVPFMMVLPGVGPIPTYEIGVVLIYISLAISLWSANDYVFDFFRAIIQKRKDAKLKKQKRKKNHPH